jgi:hypothetical protein
MWVHLSDECDLAHFTSATACSDAELESVSAEAVGT